MPKNSGTLVIAEVRPNDSLDLIAVCFANEVKGGFHSYETIAERNACMTVRREWGMLAYVWNDPTPANNGAYQLRQSNSANLGDNLNWVNYAPPAQLPTPTDMPGEGYLFRTAGGTYSIQASASGTINHTDLGGLSVGDDHTQYYNNTRLLAWWSIQSTDGLAEGGSNLYYTQARADARVQALAPGIADTRIDTRLLDGSGKIQATLLPNIVATGRVEVVNTLAERDAISNWVEGDICRVLNLNQTFIYDVDTVGNWVGITDNITNTDDVPEGVNNKYFTNARVLNVADALGTAQGLLNSHTGAADPHPQYQLESGLGTAAFTASSDYATASHSHTIFTTTTSGFVPPPNATNGYLDSSGSWTVPGGAGDLLAANNLSDIANITTARTNLGLGSSALFNVANSGNAATGEVVKGDDTRLADSRTPLAHSHTASDITSGTLGVGLFPARLASIEDAILVSGEYLQWNGSAFVSDSPTLPSVSWGSITGTLTSQTDLNTALNARLSKTSNLSDVSDVATARTNLGLAIGTNIQAYSSKLANIANTNFTTGHYLQWNGTAIVGSSVATGDGTWGSITGTLSSQTDLNAALNTKLTAASNLADLANASTARTNLGLAIGSNVQPFSSRLTTISNLALSDGQYIRWDGVAGNFVADVPSSSSVAWGDITGTLTSQVDLTSALDGKAALVHDHDAAQITSGVLALARFPDVVGLTPNTYANPSSVTIDAKGRITGIVAGTGTVPLTIESKTAGFTVTEADDGKIFELNGTFTVTLDNTPTKNIQVSFRLLGGKVFFATSGVGTTLNNSANSNFLEVPNAQATAYFNNTADSWNLSGVLGNPRQVDFPKSRSGLLLTRISGTQIAVGSGECTLDASDGSGTRYLIDFVGSTKTVDVSTNGWHYVFVIYNPATDTVDWTTDTSSTGANISASLAKQLIGTFKINSGVIHEFLNRSPGYFEYTANTPNRRQAISIPATGALYTLEVPPINCLIQCLLTAGGTPTGVDAGYTLRFSSPDNLLSTTLAWNYESLFNADLCAIRIVSAPSHFQSGSIIKNIHTSTGQIHAITTSQNYGTGLMPTAQVLSYQIL